MMGMVRCPYPSMYPSVTVTKALKILCQQKPIDSIDEIKRGNGMCTVLIISNIWNYTSFSGEKAMILNYLPKSKSNNWNPRVWGVSLLKSYKYEEQFEGPWILEVDIPIYESSHVQTITRSSSKRFLYNFSWKEELKIWHLFSDSDYEGLSISLAALEITDAGKEKVVVVS
ncbi:hypothetical protein M8C21_009610 [Ambrosia artemisiifolia]|uniref:Uncharacterized protein n=1 Tax=Ambrosia artemisiifolia TaxID=4212 RepID=A0AAD5D6P0_AMBAR|nr:hypothetical protein M8C21_009610 [Ambrosia artemisiifolia]